MGRYVNKGNADFAEARNQEYVDKSGLIGFVNRTLMEVLVGSKDKYYMKKKFINPILGVRLRMTEPNSPNSPTHKYVRIFE